MPVSVHVSQFLRIYGARYQIEDRLIKWLSGFGSLQRLLIWKKNTRMKITFSSSLKQASVWIRFRIISTFWSIFPVSSEWMEIFESGERPFAAQNINSSLTYKVAKSVISWFFAANAWAVAIKELTNGPSTPASVKKFWTLGVSRNGTASVRMSWPFWLGAK